MPRIYIENEDVCVMLEFAYTKDMFLKMKIGDRYDLSHNLSDIIYGDSGGFISIIYEKYDLHVTREDKNKFSMEFIMDSSNLEKKFEVIENIEI